MSVVSAALVARRDLPPRVHVKWYVPAGGLGAAARHVGRVRRVGGRAGAVAVRPVGRVEGGVVAEADSPWFKTSAVHDRCGL